MSEEPQFCKAIPLAAGDYITVTYADASTDDVALGSVTLYADGGSASTSLGKAIENALNADAVSKGTTWVVSEPSTGLSGRMTITGTGGSSAPTQLEFLTDDLTSRDLGLTAAATATVALTTGTVTGAYQKRWLWRPRVIISQDRPQRMRLRTGAASRTSGTGVSRDLGAVVLHRILLKYVEAALIDTVHTARTGYVDRVTGLDEDDPNAALSTFWADVAAGNVDGVPPLVRYYRDATAPTDYTSCRWLDWQQLEDLDAVATVTGETSYLLHSVRINLTEV